MTDHQVLQLLKDMGVSRVFQDAHERRLKLEIARDGPGETIPVTELKAENVRALKDLEESRQDVLENRFAAPLTTRISLGSDRTMQALVLKRDDQLTDEEKTEKRGKLLAIEKEIGRHKSVVASLNYLQVHFRELRPLIELSARKVPGLRAPHERGGKAVWLRGVKSAALHCLNESHKVGNEQVSVLELCRQFLARYVIEGEEEYTAEQLLNNIRQIRLLDRLD